MTLDNHRSHSNSVVLGVPQGVVLAPLLFLLYINNLPSRIQSKVKLYADDVLLYSFINIESDCQILREDLDALVQWAHTWEMEFNYQKCEFLRVTNKHNPVIYNHHMDSIPIRHVSHTKYLDVTIASNLSWNKHIQTITNKARQVNNFLYCNLRQCPCISYQMQLL